MTTTLYPSNNRIDDEGEKWITKSYLLSSAPFTRFIPIPGEGILCIMLLSSFQINPDAVRSRLEKPKLGRYETNEYYPFSFLTVVDNWTILLRSNNLPSSKLPEVPYSVIVKIGSVAMKAYFLMFQKI